jgi:archaellum component FlaC
VTTDERIEKLGERIDALTMNVELLTADAQTLLKAAQQDGENIRALARIAEIHDAE